MPIHIDPSALQSGQVIVRPITTARTMISNNRFRDAQTFTSTPALGTLGEFNTTISRVYDLAADEYDAEGGEYAPSYETMERANALLYDAFHALRTGFPRGFASTTGHGDIRIYWRSNDRDLHLTIPGERDRRPSLYTHLDGQDVFHESATVMILADALSQFAGA